MLRESLIKAGILWNIIPLVAKLSPLDKMIIEINTIKIGFHFLNIDFPNIMIAKISETTIPIIPARDVLPNSNHIESKDPIPRIIL